MPLNNQLFSVTRPRHGLRSLQMPTSYAAQKWICQKCPTRLKIRLPLELRRTPLSENEDTKGWFSNRMQALLHTVESTLASLNNCSWTFEHNLFLYIGLLHHVPLQILILNSYTHQNSATIWRSVLFIAASYLHSSCIEYNFTYCCN